MKASPQGKGGAQGYFAGKGQGKGKDGKDGKKGGKSKGDLEAGKGQRKLYCFDFQKGSCTRENCPFVHEIDSRPLCWDFQKHKCTKGVRCRFRHAKESGDAKNK